MGTITIGNNLYGNKTFTVTQDGAFCTYSILPTSKSFTSSGGTGSVGVTASSSSCSWTAVSSAAWITVTSGGSGTKGMGRLPTRCRLIPAPVAVHRHRDHCRKDLYRNTRGGIPSCTYSISPTSKTFTASGGTGRCRCNGIIKQLHLDGSEQRGMDNGYLRQQWHGEWDGCLFGGG